MEYFHYYNSPLGKIILAAEADALTGLWFDGQKYFEKPSGRNYEQKNLPVFEQAQQWLSIYFSGKEPDFTPPLLVKTTPFRKIVWEILLTIPYGQTITYKEIAELAARKKGLSSMSAQAAGGAVSHNRISLIIPCHRVIGTDGSLTGYAGGLDRKEKLLAMEQAGRNHGMPLQSMFLS